MNAVRKPMHAKKANGLSQGQCHICGRRRQQHLIVYEFVWWFHGCRCSFKYMDRHSHKSRSRSAKKQGLL